MYVHTGIRLGVLFSSVTDKNMIHTDEAWPVKYFTYFFRNRLHMCGVGASDVQMYSRHSLKRGCIQLYPSIGISDAQVTYITQMAGDQSYANLSSL